MVGIFEWWVGAWRRYNCAADIWSFGITLLEFALGAAPLADFSLDQILMKTLNEPAPVLESTDRRKKFTEVHPTPLSPFSHAPTNQLSQTLITT